MNSIVRSKNPITKEILWETNASTKEEINAAVENAKTQLQDWSFLAYQEREKYLINFSKILSEKKDSFAEMISEETGKPLWESKMEVDSMINKIPISIEAQNIRCKEFKSQTPYGLSITRHKPIGVVGVLGPYNFPGHLPNGHIVPALLAGNTIVFKPSELTPRIGRELAKIWQESGLPKGVLNVVHGAHETGKQLVEHPNVNAICFTGSWKSGKLIAQTIAGFPNKLLALEMGGNNPMLVGNISNVQAAAYAIVQSSFLTAGQRCTSTRRLILLNDQKGKDVLDAVIALTKKITIGAYTMRPEPFMGPVINSHEALNLITAQNALLSMGAKALHEMKQLQENSSLISPAILDVTGMSRRFDEELFGPVLQVIRVHDFLEGIKEANRTNYGLAAGILTDEKAQYEHFYAHIRAGIINWNVPTIGASSKAPFGGVGQSGNFRPSAFYAADYCNYPVAAVEAEELTLPSHPLPGIDLT